MIKTTITGHEPINPYKEMKDNFLIKEHIGMTIRHKICTDIMSGLLASEIGMTEDQMVAKSVALADKLIQELNK